MTVGFVQDESVGPEDEGQDYQDEARPTGQIASVDVGKQAGARLSEPFGTPPAHQRQEGDDDGDAPEDQQTQQSSLAGQQYLVTTSLVDAQVTVQSSQQ